MGVIFSLCIPDLFEYDFSCPRLITEGSFFRGQDHTIHLLRWPSYKGQTTFRIDPEENKTYLESLLVLNVRDDVSNLPAKKFSRLIRPTDQISPVRDPVTLEN